MAGRGICKNVDEVCEFSALVRRTSVGHLRLFRPSECTKSHQGNIFQVLSTRESNGESPNWGEELTTRMSSCPCCSSFPSLMAPEQQAIRINTRRICCHFL